MNNTVAIVSGIIKTKDTIKIDKNVVRTTIQLMEAWNDIFKSITDDNNYDINIILKNNEDLLYNLDYNNLIKTLEKYLSKLDISLLTY